MKVHGIFLYLILLPVLCGCGGDALTEIRGTVTVGEKPLVKGRIDFVPVDGQGPTAAAVIEDGKYSLKIVPGQKKVEILGFRQIGEERPWGPDRPVRIIDEQILPAKYNEKTELTRDVHRGEETYDFSLELP